MSERDPDEVKPIEGTRFYVLAICVIWLCMGLVWLVHGAPLP